MKRANGELALGTRERLLETLQRLRENTFTYSGLILKIRDKGAVLRPLEANFAQRYVEDKLENQLRESGRVRAIVLKARQEGVSTWTAARFFKRVHLQAGQKGLVVADALDRASAIFGIYERFYQNLPAELQPVRKSFANQKRLAFSHDSELAVRPASDSEAGRAQTIHCLHASELAYWPASTQRETWVSLLQAIPDDGTEIIVESTAKGAGGLFHELWELSQKKGSGWIGIFLPWWIHEEYEVEPTQAERDSIASHADDFEMQALSEGIPYEGQQWVLSISKLAWRRRKIIEAFGGDPITLGADATREFQREYPATADEAFLMSGACYFDEDELRRLARNQNGTGAREPVATGTLKQVGDEASHIIKLEKSVRGALSVFSYPDKKGHYVIGADTATGKEVVSSRTQSQEARERGGRDYSCAVVVRLGTDEKLPEVVAVLHGYLAPDIFARQIELLGKYYSCGGPSREHPTLRDPALIMVESNHASGQRVLEYLKDIIKYRRLYWQREINTRTHRVEKRPGWRTDERTREILLDSLAETVRKAKMIIPDGNMIREMTTFVIWEDGKPAGEEGCHDDRVMALALAHKAQSEHKHISTAPLKQWVPQDTPTGL